MAITYYRMTFFDDKNKLFGVSDIVTSDEDASIITCRLQRKGYNVRASNTPYVKDISEVASVEEIVRSSEGKYKYDPTLFW